VTSETNQEVVVKSEPNELLVDEKGNFVRGQEGGLKRVFERLDQIEEKVDKLIAKLPGSKIT